MLYLAIASLAIWVVLILFWGQFWLGEKLVTEEEALAIYPSVAVILPARDEAEVIADSLSSILQQDYPGNFTVVLVDDNSSDDTGIIAQKMAQKLAKEQQFCLLSGQSLPKGWKGKLWAMHQGLDYLKQQAVLPEYLLFTDADIQHHQSNLKELVIKAEIEQLDLVSLMVLLRCQSFWEKFLIPAFVFFFQQLYPFKLVNNPRLPFAAAAGGCILIKTTTLEKIGGIAGFKDALIDDCTLAKKIKSSGGKIWLGLTQNTFSLRPYESLKSIWDLVARTAFDQLNYSWLLLMITILGLGLVYLVPILAIIWGLSSQYLIVMIAGLITWLLMSLAYFPTIRLYDLSIFWIFSLPAIAFFYCLMTIDSAIRQVRGRGGLWKGRTY